MPGNDQDSEAALLFRAHVLGEVAAFSGLINLHQSKLRTFLIRLCKNYDQANDLAQETFIIAFQKLSSFRGQGSFAGWLFRIAYNCFLQWRRQASRREEISAEYARMIEVDAARYDAMTADQFDLEKAMLQLRSEESAALTLCFSFGFSHTEAAEILKSPLGTVKSNISRGRKKLQELLVKKQGEEEVKGSDDGMDGEKLFKTR